MQLCIHTLYVRVLFQEETDCPDLEYIYSDTDTHLNEMAELYSYSELNDYQTNIQVKTKNLKMNDVLSCTVIEI